MEFVDILGWTSAIASVIIILCMAIFSIAGVAYIVYLVIDNWLYERRRKK